jgi:hypothetical protein
MIWIIQAFIKELFMPCDLNDCHLLAFNAIIIIISIKPGNLIEVNVIDDIKYNLINNIE